MSLAESTQTYLVAKQSELARLIEAQIHLLSAPHLIRLFGLQSVNAACLADALRERTALPAEAGRLLETIERSLTELAKLLPAADRDGTG
jgi:hypothetical protein